MAISQVFSMGWQGGGGAQVTSAVTFTGDGASAVDVTLATGAITDQLVEVTIPTDAAGLTAVEMIVTGNALADVVIETNATTGVQTFTFPTGGGRLTWDNTCPAEITCPITTTVTKIYITQAAAAQTPRIQINACYS